MPVAETSRAVFLSYASQDREAAVRIAEALRAAGIEVWLDQSELRGGDVWDQKIRREISECALFLPLISSNTAARREGYFRLEWDLADQRTHRMARNSVFIVPVCVDATPETGTDVPESFQRAQWTRLPQGATPPAFVDRVQRLLAPESSPMKRAPADGATLGATRGRPWAVRRLLTAPAVIAALVVLGAAAYFAIERFRAPASSATARVGPSSTGTPASPPPKSIAVLPFADLSENRDQEYFADGLTEELIDLLTKIQDLTVPARTSAFYFKGKAEDVSNIARQLKVAHVLEGSVRKSGNHIRVTAQLVRADTGYHLWSETYDRKLDDLFKVQDDIAGSVVRALKSTFLTADLSRNNPTANAEAHTLYLRALSLGRDSSSASLRRAYGELRRAVSLDPNFALAWAAMAQLLTDDTVGWQLDSKGELASSELRNHERTRQFARAAADKAAQLDPQLPQAHLAKALVLYWMDWNWSGAGNELRTAHELDPSSAEITDLMGQLNITIGRLQEGLQLATAAAGHDPLGTAYWTIGAARFRLGDLAGAAYAYRQLVELYPTGSAHHYRHALVLLTTQQSEAALTEVQQEPNPAYRQAGLPLALDSLGRRSEADRELARLERDWGDEMAYQISYVYAARDDVEHAIVWLDRAFMQRDSGLLSIKHDPMLRKLESEPRYQSLLRAMNLQD